MATIHNPIIRGFNPDPCVCRVGKDFYLVTSTFEFFPGIPIYHSTDLANWELIGHCIVDSRQIKLDGVLPSKGLYAPTLRHFNGIFYLTCTNVTGGGHFLMRATSIKGPWSDPEYINVGGIDPSLYFEDGKCYFHCSHEWEGQQCILQCLIDPITGKVLCEPKPITYGFGGKYPEGPHMYRRGNKYYLLLAEGGTEYGHMVTIMRSDSPWGPFEMCPRNPILTHSDGNAVHSSFQCVGHADLFCDEEGKWWIVSLGIRPLPGVLLHNLGRETLLGHVDWQEDDWPIINRCGLMLEKIESKIDSPNRARDFVDAFCSSSFDPEYCFVRNPVENNYCFTKKGLKMKSGAPLSTITGSPTFLGVRQKEWKMHAETELCSVRNGFAGLSVYYNGEHHYDIGIREDTSEYRVEIRKRIFDLESVVMSQRIVSLPVKLCIDSDPDYYTLSIIGDHGEVCRAYGATAGLCTEITRNMTFTGVFIGLFCEDGSAEFGYIRVTYSHEQ